LAQAARAGAAARAATQSRGHRAPLMVGSAQHPGQQQRLSEWARELESPHRFRIARAPAVRDRREVHHGQVVEAEGLLRSAGGAPLTQSPAHRRAGTTTGGAGGAAQRAAVTAAVGSRPTAEPDSVAAGIKFFAESHPGFAEEVWRMAPGRYTIRGRLVSVSEVLSQPAAARGLVRVDGSHRPLEEALEDFWNELVLERKANRAMLLRQFISARLEEESRLQSDDLLRKCLHVFRRYYGPEQRVRVRLRLSSAFMITLRSHWASWVAATRKGLRRRLAEPQLRLLDSALLHGALRQWFTEGITVQSCWNAWRTCMQAAKAKYVNAREAGAIEASQHRLRGMLRALPLALETADDAMRAAFFMRWSREVERGRRLAAEAFLHGESGMVKRDMERLSRQSVAKDLLMYPSWDGPEVRLGRLSTVLDGLLERLDVRERTPVIAPAARRSTLAREEAAGLLGALSHTRGVAERLGADIAFVLELRCFSLWSRGFYDEQASRRIAGVKAREELACAGQLAVATRLAAHAARSRFVHLMYAAFVEWAFRWAEARTMRMGEASWLDAERARREDMRNEVQSKATCIVQGLMEFRNKAGAMEMLPTLLLRWSMIASASQHQRNLSLGEEQLHQRMAAMERARSQLVSLSVERCGLVARRRLLTGVVIGWDARVRRLQLQRWRHDLGEYAAGLHRARLLQMCLVAFARLLLSGARRSAATLATTTVLASLGGFVAIVTGHNCFSVWKNCAHLRRDHVLMERGRCLRERCRSGTVATMELLCAARAETTVKLMLGRWLSFAKVTRHRHDMEARTERLSAIDSHIELQTERARRRQRQLGERVGDALAVPLVWGVLVLWAVLARRTAQEHVGASKWLQHRRRTELTRTRLALAAERSQRLSGLIEDVIVDRLTGILSRGYCAWRLLWQGRRFARRTWSRRSVLARRTLVGPVLQAWRGAAVRARLRLVARRLSQATVTSSGTVAMARALLSWRALAVARTGWRTAERLLALQAVACLISRRKGEALRRWQSINAAASRRDGHRGVAVASLPWWLLRRLASCLEVWRGFGRTARRLRRLDAFFARPREEARLVVQRLALFSWTQLLLPEYKLADQAAVKGTAVQFSFPEPEVPAEADVVATSMPEVVFDGPPSMVKRPWITVSDFRLDDSIDQAASTAGTGPSWAWPLTRAAAVPLRADAVEEASAVKKRSGSPSRRLAGWMYEAPNAEEGAFSGSPPRPAAAEPFSPAGDAGSDAGAGHDHGPAGAEGAGGGAGLEAAFSFGSFGKHWDASSAAAAKAPPGQPLALVLRPSAPPLRRRTTPPPPSTNLARPSTPPLSGIGGAPLPRAAAYTTAVSSPQLPARLVTLATSTPTKSDGGTTDAAALPLASTPPSREDRGLKPLDSAADVSSTSYMRYYQYESGRPHRFSLP